MPLGFTLALDWLAQSPSFLDPHQPCCQLRTLPSDHIALNLHLFFVVVVFFGGNNLLCLT